MLIELEVFGDVQLRRELLRFRGAVVDASPAFEQILRGTGRGVTSLRKIESKQFATQGKFASGGWAPLSPYTVAEKARKGLDPRILHATGRLAASLTGGSGKIEVVSPHQMVFGTSVFYARFHQTGARSVRTSFDSFGTKYIRDNRRRLPRRRPIELREQDRRDMVRTLQRHLLGEL